MNYKSLSFFILFVLLGSYFSVAEAKNEVCATQGRVGAVVEIKESALTNTVQQLTNENAQQFVNDFIENMARGGKGINLPVIDSCGRGPCLAPDLVAIASGDAVGALDHKIKISANVHNLVVDSIKLGRLRKEECSDNRSIDACFSINIISFHMHAGLSISELPSGKNIFTGRHLEIATVDSVADPVVHFKVRYRSDRSVLDVVHLAGASIKLAPGTIKLMAKEASFSSEVGRFIFSNLNNALAWRRLHHGEENPDPFVGIIEEAEEKSIPQIVADTLTAGFSSALKKANTSIHLRAPIHLPPLFLQDIVGKFERNEIAEAGDAGGGSHRKLCQEYLVAAKSRVSGGIMTVPDPTAGTTAIIDTKPNDIINEAKSRAGRLNHLVPSDGLFLADRIYSCWSSAQKNSEADLQREIANLLSTVSAQKAKLLQANAFRSAVIKNFVVIPSAGQTTNRGTIAAGMALCEQSINLGTETIAGMLGPSCGANYDLAVRLSLTTLNRLISSYFLATNREVCLNVREISVLQNAFGFKKGKPILAGGCNAAEKSSLTRARVFIKFGEAPRLGADAQGLFLELPGLMMQTDSLLGRYKLGLSAGYNSLGSPRVYLDLGAQGGRPTVQIRMEKNKMPLLTNAEKIPPDLISFVNDFIGSLSLDPMVAGAYKSLSNSYVRAIGRGMPVLTQTPRAIGDELLFCGSFR